MSSVAHLTVEGGIDLITLLCWGKYKEFCESLYISFAWGITSQGMSYWTELHRMASHYTNTGEIIPDRLITECVKALENEMDRTI